MSTGGFIPACLNRLIEGRDLTREEARQLMSSIMEGSVTQSQIGAVLMALRIKGETVDEITGFAEAMRNVASTVKADNEKLLDTCGTGGSGIHKFNISTASAIISSAASVRVAKHGNRSASGRAGSADVLEALGVNIHLSSEQAKRCLDEIGICFLFAQLYHPSMKHAAVPRKELGIRTVFNMLEAADEPGRSGSAAARDLRPQPDGNDRGGASRAWLQTGACRNQPRRAGRNQHFGADPGLGAAGRRGAPTKSTPTISVSMCIRWRPFWAGTRCKTPGSSSPCFKANEARTGTLCSPTPEHAFMWPALRTASPKAFMPPRKRSITEVLMLNCSN